MLSNQGSQQSLEDENRPRLPTNHIPETTESPDPSTQHLGLSAQMKLAVQQSYAAEKKKDGETLPERQGSSKKKAARRKSGGKSKG